MDVYLVGGAVRDKLLNLPVKDKDWVVVGGTEKMLLEKNFQQVGKDFPVFLHPITHEEYALARKERKISKGHHGFQVTCNDYVTLKDDLIRRDFTMNAIAQDKYGNYIDPFNGRQDIKKRVIRHVSKSFVEDPLRVLRAARFSSVLTPLGFYIADETMKLMKKIVQNQELLYLTPDRIWNETKKAFYTLYSHVYFQVLHACGALNVFFPNLYILYDLNIFYDTSVFKKLYDYRFILMGLAKFSILNKNIEMRFSYLCQFLSFNQNMNNFSEELYDIKSALIIKNLCKRFHIPSYIRDIAVLNTGFCVFLKRIKYQSSKDIIKMFYKVDAWRKPERIKQLSFLSSYSFLHGFHGKCFQKNRFCYLTQCFSIVQNISIKDILNHQLKGYEIKTKIMQLRIKTLEKWRLKIRSISKNINNIL